MAGTDSVSKPPRIHRREGRDLFRKMVLEVNIGHWDAISRPLHTIKPARTDHYFSDGRNGHSIQPIVHSIGPADE